MRRSLRIRRAVALLLGAIVLSLLMTHFQSRFRKVFGGQGPAVPNISSLFRPDFRRFGSKSQKRVLITGGLGTIGSALAKRLLAEQFTVTIVDNHKDLKSLAGIRTSATDNAISENGMAMQWDSADSPLSFVLGDIQDTLLLQDLLSSDTFLGVIHLAAIADQNQCLLNPEACLSVNRQGTQSLIDALNFVRSNATPIDPWVIHISPSNLWELPDGPYLESRLGGEEVVQQAASHDRSDLPLRAMIIRLPEIYGSSSRQDHGIVATMLQGAFTDMPIDIDHSDRLDLLHIDDCVNGLVLAIEQLERSRNGFTFFQRRLARPVEYNMIAEYSASTSDVLETIIRMTRSLAPLRVYPEQRQSSMSKTAVPNIPGFRPAIKFSRGIKGLLSAKRLDLVQYGSHYLRDHCMAPSPEDVENHDLSRLHDCRILLSMSIGGKVVHMRGEHGELFADGQKLQERVWGEIPLRVNVLEFDPITGDNTVQFQVADGEKTSGLGVQFISKSDSDDGLDLLWDPLKAEEGTNLTLQLEPNSPAFRLLLKQDSKVVVPSQPQALVNFTAHDAESVESYDWRITPVCCPRNGPWPFLKDDYAFSDVRWGQADYIPFNSTNRLHRCRQVQQAVDKATRDQKWMATIDVEDVLSSVGQAPPWLNYQPTYGGGSELWVKQQLPACWNDCESPFTCVPTDECRCVAHNSCRRDSLPAVPSMPSSERSDEAHLPSSTSTGNALVRAVEKLSSKSALLPAVVRYIDTSITELKVHVITGYDGEAESEAESCHRIQNQHCFSADSALYGAMRKISVSPEDADFIVHPVYQQCGPVLDKQIEQRAQQMLKNVEIKPIIMALTHDWGICWVMAWDVWSIRKSLTDYGSPIGSERWRNTILFTVMGDYDQKCYRPEHDILIPARSCASPRLYGAFGDMNQVRPAAERKHLVAWAGSFWGTGSVERQRLTCSRGGISQAELEPGYGPQSLWGFGREQGLDYMGMLGDSRFCPLPRGTAGWAPRTSDAIFSGCIPVLLSEGSHYPFPDVIDWSKISVRVDAADLDRIEEILLAIPMAEVESLQAHMMTIREAFMYAQDGHFEEEVDRRGPLYFASLTMGLRRSTYFPSELRTVVDMSVM